ncbi:MAG: ProQ/FINO family protein [Endozoicomonas sp.]
MQYECNTENPLAVTPDTHEDSIPEVHAEKSEPEISKSEALKLVRERWPEAFRVSSPRPLKVGIHNDMKQTGEYPVAVIKSALKFFTSQERYLLSIKPGRNRIGLDGKPCGKVKLNEAVNAEITLFQRQENRNRKNQRVHVGQLKLVKTGSADDKPAQDSET